MSKISRKTSLKNYIMGFQYEALFYLVFSLISRFFMFANLDFKNLSIETDMEAKQIKVFFSKSEEEI